MSKTATFIGHSECLSLKKEDVLSEIINLIEQEGVDKFIIGGMGNFDWLCAMLVHSLRGRYPHIRSYLIIPYLTFKITSREYFDDIIYPEGFENYHFKAAITKRNRYLVDNSNYAICYIDHGWGGAAQTYEYAKRKQIKTINIGKYE